MDRIQTRVNEQIRVPQVRVIDVDGRQLGIMSRDEALQKAREAELDLVEVAPNERPPVCRIMDFGKFKYEKRKRGQQHSHQTKIKEIRLRPKTGEHDLNFKIKQARGFLEDKDKVVVTVLFRGREVVHVEEGQRMLERVIEELSPYGKVESPIQRVSPTKLTCTLAPK